MSKKAAQASKGMNKSKAIRDYKEKNPDSGPSAIAAALNAEGYNVSVQFVSTVLSNAKRKGGVISSRGRRRRATSPGLANLDDLIAAKQLVTLTGGIEQAKATIDALARLL